MTSLTRDLLALTTSNNITLTAHHLAGEKNIVADLLSRPGHICKNEWCLDKRTFAYVQRKATNLGFGPLTVDLFANALTKQLPRYGSPHHDDYALLTDALQAKWPVDEGLYAFPPTTIIDRVLAKIREERPPRLTLIAPNSPNTSWYPAFKRIARDIVPTGYLQLRQPHWNYQHHNPISLRLGVWILRGTDW